MTCSECHFCRVNGEMREGKIIKRCRSHKSQYNGQEVKSGHRCSSFEWADPAAERFAAARHQCLT